MIQVSGNGNGNGHKRAVLYARVSTDDQKDKGYSLPSQFEAMRRYATQEGFEIVGEFQYVYSGASPIVFSPVGANAYTMLKSGNADAIIAYRIDRYVRPPEDGDEWDLPVLIRGLAKLGKEIHVCNRGKLGTTFADLLTAMLDAKKAGEERRDFRERSMRGKHTKARGGKVIACQPALGYCLVRDSNGKALMFEIVEEEAGIVRVIFRWYVYGDESGKPLSIRAIAAKLSALRVKTPREFKKGHTTQTKRENGVWNIATIRDILSNEAYAGTWHYGKRIGASNRMRPLESTIAVNIPAIIDDDTWARTQIQRQRNAQFSRRNRKREYLLSGLIVCGKCGFSWTGQQGNKTRLYYRCSSRVHRFAKIEDFCRAFVRADAIEFDVWREIEELFSDLDRLWDDLKKAQQAELTAQDPQRDELETVETLIKHADREVTEIATALPKANGRVAEVLQEKMKEANARYESLTKRRDEIQSKMGARKLTDEVLTGIMEYARKVRRGIAKADYFTKRRILESLGVKVTIQDGCYLLECVLGKVSGKISKVERGGKIVIASKECSSRQYL